jgi:hydrogenase maturation protein HypF
MVIRLRLTIHGTVQGVGFRPYVYRLARQHGLGGLVYNDSQGVLVEVEGEQSAVGRFLEELPQRAPAQSRIERIRAARLDLQGQHDFQIKTSLRAPSNQIAVPPDLGICTDCLRELSDPRDRRYGYALINCTQCGPRYSIVLELPYDRPGTTLKDFQMCAECAAEYHDPGNRRFHAQPIGCPNCGPRLNEDLDEAAATLRRGEVLALKGVGGYHQLCRADRPAAVAGLRRLKQRPRQPLALMGELQQIEEFCRLSRPERELLLSPARPIVLLRPRRRLPGVAPGQPRSGWMLPYSGLHALLLRRVGSPLAVTSANAPGEPVVYEDEHVARPRLSHQRPIQNRCDDSLVSLVEGQPVVLRRARGYCPEPLSFGGRLEQPVLACGGSLKSTFALGLAERAYLSPHLGDLSSLGSREAYRQTLQGLQDLLGIRPVLAVHDLHPDCPAAVLRGDLPGMGVQHHHAHIVSVMAEHGLDEEVLGLAFDGNGYGTDGTIWGGEFLLATRADFQRVGHFPSVPQPGGDLAAREPWRMAAAHLHPSDYQHLPWWRRRSLAEQKTLRALLAHPATPRTTSLGRLFDAAACLILGRSTVTFEAEAAMELEGLAGGRPQPAYPVRGLHTGPMWASLLADLAEGVSRKTMAQRFHSWLVEASHQTCLDLGGGRPVVLSGGVFQNRLLLERLLSALRESGLRVYFNRQVPPNDGGLSFGQLAIAAARLA